MSPVAVARPPDAGVWRVGRAPDPLGASQPLSADDLDNPKTGNRFDSPLGSYQMLYFSSSLEGCFGETLARFRPDVGLLKVIGTEWQDLGFMGIGDVPRDWRQKRLAVRVRFPSDPARFPAGIDFLDVDSIATRETLRSELAGILAYYNLSDADAATVYSNDRRVTRWIGQWAYDAHDEQGKPLYAGIRYSSRLDPSWECWGVFHDVPIASHETRPVSEHDEAMRKIAKTYKLRVH
jgi:hypothetical protein